MTLQPDVLDLRMGQWGPREGRVLSEVRQPIRDEPKMKSQVSGIFLKVQSTSQASVPRSLAQGKGLQERQPSGFSLELCLNLVP